MTTLPTSTRPPISVRALCPRASFVDCADVLVSALTADSRECRPGDTFVAMPGVRFDGSDFAAEAVRRGAHAVVAPSPLANINVPQAVVANVRDVYARLAAGLHGNPAQQLKTVGVTGTNGKTTVTWLVRSILENAGHACGLLGTIEYSDGRQTIPATMTTPDALEINRRFRQMVLNRTPFAAIEVSSHALDQSRIAGADLDVAVITNITQDHFDYHADDEHYANCKRRILDHVKPGGAIVLNFDDPKVRSFMPEETEGVTTFGLTAAADLHADILDENNRGSVFLMQHGGEAIEIRTSLVGRHNISNCLAAVAAVLPFGLSLDEIACGISSLASVPGRLERIDCGQAFSAFVDYAHTDDALRRAVRTLKQHTSGRVICVFGAGGDRDRTKRPLLGKAAAAADVLIVTSDNPRSEDPLAIIEDITRGIPAGREMHTDVLREQAIQRAVEMAEPGDCLLVAGKGHETTQTIGDKRRDFDDREVVRQTIVDRCVAAAPVPVRQSA